MSDPVILRSPNLGADEAPICVRLYEAARPLPFKNGGLARAAQAVRSGGRGGDDVLLHINAKELEFLRHVWGDPSYNPHTGLPEYGLFSKLKKALKFETFNVKGIIKDIAKNPQRLLTGAVDPISTKLTNAVFGTHYKPVVNQLGGATEQRFRDAEAKGMDTGTARTLHKIAGTVAGIWGGNAAANAASWGLGNAASDLEALGAARDPGALQTAINTGAKAADTASTYLENPAAKAGEYAKDPKHWGTIAKAVGALGVLGGGGGGDEQTGGAPATPSSPGLKQLPFGRTQTGQNMDWYTYGERPEQAFYTDNVLPAFTPDEQKPGARHGGLGSRFVRGPGTGRSDSIDARLSDGEYVLTAEDVALLGDGSSDAGARRLDQFRQNLRKHKGGALARGKISPNAKSPLAYMKGER